MSIIVLIMIGSGADPGFSEGGSESGVDLEPNIVSLKQGVWGHSPPEAMGYLILFSTKIPLI